MVHGVCTNLVSVRKRTHFLLCEHRAVILGVGRDIECSFHTKRVEHLCNAEIQLKAVIPGGCELHSFTVARTEAASGTASSHSSKKASPRGGDQIPADATLRR